MFAALPVKSIAQVEGYKPFDPNAYVEKTSFFKTLEVAVSGGTSGIGIDFASKINPTLQLRAGFSVMPHLVVPLNFDLGSDVPGLKSSKIDEVCAMFYDFTGYKIDRTVQMDGIATYHNFKLIVDLFPFKNKKWHVSAGFYWGNSKVGYAENATRSATSLVSVGMYNALYDKFKDTDFAALANTMLPGYTGGIPNVEYSGNLYDKMIASRDSWAEFWDTGNPDALVTWGNINGVPSTVPEDYTDEQVKAYATKIEMVELVDKLDKMKKYGHLGARLGEDDNGKAYILYPDEEAMVKVRAFANAFKPYVGFGYGGTIDREKRMSLSFDCGVLFWGGSPNVITHDGTSLKYQIHNIPGKVGDLVDIAGKFSVWPILDLRLAYRLF